MSMGVLLGGSPIGLHTRLSIKRLSIKRLQDDSHQSAQLTSTGLAFAVH